MYSSFKLIHQKVDYARYAILYCFGGVSIDVDAKALKPLDATPQLDKSDLIVSKNSLNTFINNATIFSSKNNSILKKLIDGIRSSCSRYPSDAICVLNTTGPQYFDRFIKANGQATVLDSKYLEPCGGLNKYCQVKEESILDHRHEGSWLSPTMKKLMQAQYFLLYHKTSILAILFLLVILYLVTKL